MKKLSTALIALGILIVLGTIVGNIYNSYIQNKMYYEYTKQIESQIIKMDEAFEEVKSDEEDGLGSSEELNTSRKEAIGIIRIPKISLRLPIVEGSGTEELKWGAGHITGTPMPGETGNTSLAAHRDYAFGTYFSRLDELSVDDEVIIDYMGKSYKYLVTDSFIVEPSQVSVLKNTNEPTITLITCHPRGSGKQRLIVKGKLVNELI